MDWLYPANTKFYDVIGAFSQAETYWPVNSNVIVGDTVYIYLAAPYKQIAFVCQVSEMNLGEEKIIDYIRPFFKKAPQNKKPSKSFMKLQGISKIPIEKESRLSYSFLKENGLNGMLMGPRKLDNNPLLFNYIKGNLS
ncbi:MAG: hypothetical protein OEV42_11665 [Deltaproteobacteria bacterium]|nr:hypothetical protein [Deltaproteobacteria bacterium]